MIVSCKCPHEFAKRVRKVIEWRKKSRRYGHMRNVLGDILRELLGAWVQEMEDEMEAEGE